MAASTKEAPAEALKRIQGGRSHNDDLVYMAFKQQGYADVRPRENVLTFHAWKAKGRSVRKGEKGTAVTVYVPIAPEQDSGDDQEQGEQRKKRRNRTRPKRVHLFHYNQTQPMKRTNAGKRRGWTRKAGGRRQTQQGNAGNALFN